MTMIRMTRKVAFFLMVLSISIVACDKKLPPEEQQRLQKEADSRKIQRVTENQMVEFVQLRGERILSIIDSLENSGEATPILRAYLGEEFPINYVSPADATQGELKEVMEAYMFSVANNEGTGVNLQKLENGNFMYTIPDLTDSAGIKVLRGIWKVEFIRKNMVNEIFAQEMQE